MKEWRAVTGYEGSYEVSSGGAVRSLDRIVRFADGRTRKYKGQELAQYADGVGYTKVTLKVNGDACRVHVHVLVAEAFIGPRPDGLVVCHCDGDRANNTPGNLRYDTVQGNSDDTAIHGTRAQGERCGAAKLTASQVREIRGLRGVLTQDEIALRFGTSKTNVCNIQLGARWNHVIT